MQIFVSLHSLGGITRQDFAVPTQTRMRAAVGAPPPCILVYECGSSVWHSNSPYRGMIAGRHPDPRLTLRSISAAKKAIHISFQFHPKYSPEVNPYIEKQNQQ